MHIHLSIFEKLGFSRTKIWLNVNSVIYLDILKYIDILLNHILDSSINNSSMLLMPGP